MPTPTTSKFVVQYADGRYYRDGGRQPRHFIHNATKLSRRKADQIAAETNGTVQPAQAGAMTIGS